MRPNVSAGCFYWCRTACLTALTLSAIASPAAQAQQTPPVYQLSKTPNVNTSGDVFLDILNQGLSPGQFNTLIVDVDPTTTGKPSFSDSGATLNTAPLLGITDTFFALGSQTNDIRSVSVIPGTSTCSPTFEIKAFIPTKITKVENATLSLPRTTTSQAPVSPQDCFGWVETLSVETELILDKGVIRDDFNTRLAFKSAVDFTVRGKGNKYLIKQAASPTDIDLMLEANSELYIGDRPYVSTLATTLDTPSNSSLTMAPGSSLTIDQSVVNLMADVDGNSAFQPSAINQSNLILNGSATEKAQLALSVVNINDSSTFFRSPQSELRAVKHNFTGSNLIQGFAGASLARKTQSSETAGTVIDVAGATTTITCASTDCSTGSFNVFAETLTIQPNATLSVEGDVDFRPEVLTSVVIDGTLATNGVFSSQANSIGTNALSELRLASTGKLELRDDLSLFPQASAIVRFSGDIEAAPIGGSTAASRDITFELGSGGQLTSQWTGASLSVRVNPAGWSETPAPGVTLNEYSDRVVLAANSSQTVTDLNTASVTLEAADPTLVANDYVTGGFNGQGLYNVVQTGGTVSAGGNDRFGSVFLGASMPSGLVARVVRGFDDGLLVTQPSLGVQQRVVQVQLALAADAFSVAYPDAVLNEGQSLTVTPTVTNGSGTLEFFSLAGAGNTSCDPSPVGSSPAWAGTCSIDPATGAVTVVPGTVGADCGVGTGNQFEITVLGTRDDPPNPFATDQATLLINVCDGTSASPSISYTNILDGDNVTVGTSISKTPTVAGFSPTLFEDVPANSLANIGLLLDPNTGVISGTLSKAANGADAAFTIRASVGGGAPEASDPVTLVVDPVVSYTGEQAEIGVAFTSAAPAVSAYVDGSPGAFSLKAPQPAGTWSIAADGKISGTPEAFGDQIFTVGYQVGPQGAANEVEAKFVLRVIGDPITVTYSPATYEPGEPVALTPSTTNVRDPATLVFAASGLPTGWTINPNTGEISGAMPTGAEPVIQVTATDKYTGGSTSLTIPKAPPVSQVVTGGPGGVQATLTVSGCSAIASAAFIAPPNTPSKPNADFPFDLLDFSLTGCSTLPNAVLIEIKYSQNFPAGGQFFKEEGGQYFGFQGAIGTDSVTYVLTDNGSGDDDSTAGVIRDPAGVGIPNAVTTPDPIPSIPALLLWVLSLLIGWMGYRNWYPITATQKPE